MTFELWLLISLGLVQMALGAAFQLMRLRHQRSTQKLQDQVKGWRERVAVYRIALVRMAGEHVIPDPYCQRTTFYVCNKTDAHLADWLMRDL